MERELDEKEYQSALSQQIVIKETPRVSLVSLKKNSNQPFDKNSNQNSNQNQNVKKPLIVKKKQPIGLVSYDSDSNSN